MTSSKVTRKIAAICGAACLSLSILACPVASLPVQAAAPGGETVSPMYDTIGWRFKIENHAVWRRLYNYSTSRWLGEWEYVGPWSGDE